MANVKNLREGHRLLDHRTRSEGRVIILQTKINPAGLEVGPYWQVKNEDTDRQTLIREDTFAGARWDNLTAIDEASENG